MSIDPKLLLIQQYFYTCKLLREEVIKRKPLLTTEGDHKDEIDKLIVFHEMFLGSLFVVCEGFRELHMSEPTIDRLISMHFVSLRTARNGVFHFQKSPDKKQQFFAPSEDRMNWAEDLYFMFEDYFQMTLIREQIKQGIISPEINGKTYSARGIQNECLRAEGMLDYREDIISRAKQI